MINGLRDNEAVKIGENYLVKLSSYFGDLLYDGEKIENTSQPILVQSIDKFSLRQKSKPAIEHYVDAEGNAISIEDLRKIRNKYYNDTLEEYIYPSLEVEFEHRKELEKYKKLTPVYEKIPEFTYSPVTITVIGEMVDTGSKFIQSALSFGMKSFSGETNLFRVDGMAIALDEILSYKDRFTVDTPSHGGLRFAKVDGSYLFDENEFWWMNSNHRMTSTLEAAKELEASIRLAVSNRIKIKVKVDIPSKLAYNAIYSRLKAIHRQVMSIAAMKNSSSARLNALSDINKLITTIESNIQELEKEEDTTIK